MPFSPPPLRDILLVDLETSGTDPLRHGIAQVGALLLDQVTFDEHGTIDLHVRLAESDEIDPESAKVSRIDELAARSAFAVPLAEALDQLEALGKPDEVVLAAWNADFDVSFLRAAYRRLDRPWPWDFHVLELWSVAWALRPDLPSPTIAQAKKALEIGNPHTHDALEDCRLEAEILRRLMKRA